MDEIQLRAGQRLGELRGMFEEMVELGRMRSDFALRQFVVGQHDMPGRQRAQALAELQSLYFSMSDVYDDLECSQMELEDALEDAERTNEERARRYIEISINRLRRKILNLTIHLSQRLKEVDCLLELLKNMPRYTAEQLEQEEREYWLRRLTRQAFLAMIDPGGNKDALLQMATRPGKVKPVLPFNPADAYKSMGLDDDEIRAFLLQSGIALNDGKTAGAGRGRGKRGRAIETTTSG